MSVQAMSWVFQHSHSRLGARLVLLAIANHADLHGRNSWASVGQLAEESHLSERQARYALRELEHDGEIVRVASSPRRTHVYELPGMADLWAQAEGAISAPAESAGGNPRHLRGQNPVAEGEQTAPEPSVTVLNRPKALARFAEFWTIYPRKVGKPKARAAFERAVRHAEVDAILAGARRYASDPNRDPEFTAHPTTWLNRDGWEDDPLPARGQDPYTTEQERLRQEKNAEARRFVEEERRVRRQEQS